MTGNSTVLDFVSKQRDNRSRADNEEGISCKLVPKAGEGGVRQG